MNPVKPAAFRFRPFSRRQKQALTWWCSTSPMQAADGLIADGSIRSGKTVSLSLSFVLWGMARFNGQNFALCGKTIASLRRNVVERPLFAYFRIPLANRNDRHSPLGASVYAPAVDTIHDADEQFGRLLWEYEGGQLAIDVDAAALRPTGDGGFQMDQRSGRLYRGCMTGNVADRTLFNVFAPALRDEAYLRGLDGILKRIEFQCGLAYGTLSDPQNVDKTATEIMASKQRSYSTVKSIQHALQVALDDLLYAMNAYADLYQLAPAGSYTAVYNWDDSIVNDPSERKQLFWQYVQAGKFPMQRYLTEFEGYSQEEAAQIAAETSAENNADETLTFAP